MIRWLEKNKIYSWIFMILIAIEIFYFSSITGSAGPGGGNPWHPRIYHFAVFFLFTFFLFTSVVSKKKFNLKYFLTVIFISILYAISDEIHQIFVPFRSANLSDILTDSLGVFFSTIIYVYSKRKLRN